MSVKGWLLAWACLAACVPTAAKAEVPQELTELRPAVMSGKRVTQTALYLDTSSLHVVDADDESLTVSARLLESADALSFTETAAVFRLNNDGRQELRAPDGTYREAEGESALAAEEILSELGREERRAAFLGEIEQILFKKAEAAEAEKAAKEKSAQPRDETAAPEEPPAAQETSPTEAKPVEIFVTLQEEPPSPTAEPAASEKKSGETNNTPAEKADAPEEKVSDHATPFIVVEIVKSE